MPDDEPTPRQITREILIFAALFLLVGAAFVAARVWRDGPRVLQFDPRSGDPRDDDAGDAGPR